MTAVLVATDLTRDSENAFIRAIQLSELSGATLHVLHVAHAAHPAARIEDAAPLLAEIRERIRILVGQHVTSSGFNCEIHVESQGSAYDAIEHHARKLGVDLLVIGRSIRSDAIPDSVLLTMGRVVANARCAVLVVSQPVSGYYVHVLLNTDLAHSPERILPPVRSLGPQIRLTLLVTGPAQPDSQAGIIQRWHAGLQRRKRERFRARAVDYLQQRGISPDRISIELAAPDDKEVLLAKLVGREIDVVVLSGVQSKLLREPSSAHPSLDVLRRASCDVLVLGDT